MGFEIEYLPVGTGGKNGDAIALRFGDLSSTDREKHTVVIIDGGTKDSGQALVEHINEFYNTNRVDFVISTHLDIDHISGLTVVLEKMEVDNLLMHLPWEHEEQIDDLFKNNKNLEERLQKSLEAVRDVEELAIEKSIPIYEPFTGLATQNGTIKVLGPKKEYYEGLIPHFRKTPEAKHPLPPSLPMIFKAAEEVINWINDTFDLDLLNDDEKTSCENNSSAIVLLTLDGHKLLFTGDAGIDALTMAADYAEEKGIDLVDLNLFHIPHHGSKHNVGSSILKRIKGKTAIISATGKSDKHPSKKVTNALKKHGSKVFVNGGKTLRHHHNAPTRDGWVEASDLPFYDRVEE